MINIAILSVLKCVLKTKFSYLPIYDYDTCDIKRHKDTNVEGLKWFYFSSKMFSQISLLFNDRLLDIIIDL